MTLPLLPRPRPTRRLLAAGCLALPGLAACSPASLLNGLSSDAGVEENLDLPYGPAARQRLDVYRPADARGAPVAVFFYGGAWQDGAKADYAFVGRALAAHGIVAVVADYRVYPEARFAGFMRDGAAAFAWAKRNAARYGGDSRRTVLMGHSAGAHIALLLAVDGRWFGAAGLDPRHDVAGAVGLAGPYDFLPLTDPTYKVIFGPPARLADTQPVNFVRGGEAPAFLATDADDTTVEPRNTYSLAERLSRVGSRVETRTYPGLTHRTLIGVVSRPLGGTAPVLGDVTGFILSVPPSRR